jgi:hypothetical protein
MLGGMQQSFGRLELRQQAEDFILKFHSLLTAATASIWSLPTNYQATT